MTNEVSLTISKILNWTTEQTSCRVEVAFYGVTSGAYLSHKTTLGYSSAQAFILNTSFKITYNGPEHVVNDIPLSLTARSPTFRGKMAHKLLGILRSTSSCSNNALSSSFLSRITTRCWR
jgi:hypothetical protein